MLQEYLTTYQQRNNQFLQQALSQYPTGKLTEAMQYALLLGGKRIRPILIYATGEMLGVKTQILDAVAGSMEAIHAYSLIHDDLPAMDNDELRRGKPTCHLVFDEATAILAGDALQAFAFELLSQSLELSAEQKINLIQVLAKNAGAKGMCYGQSLDLQWEQQHITLEQLESIHRHKTGALFQASVLMGFLCSAHTHDQNLKSALMEYACNLGLAFQVQDDILNCNGDPKLLGKNVGTDLALDKNTYPKFLGLEQAQAYAQQLEQQALVSLEKIPFDSSILSELAKFIVNRQV